VIAPRAARTAPSARLERRFDGLICLGGGDWWYHNRGHYDVQMMRHLRRRLDIPVLYVNSLGVRIPHPGEGRMFVRRIRRKVQSWMRGLQLVDPGFAVLSPIAVPGRLGMIASARSVVLQIASAARKLGITRPLLWIECPSGIEVADHLDRVALVYQRTDFWEAFPEGDARLLRDYDRRLKGGADVVLYASRHFFEQERTGCNAARFLDHGVDYELFESAARAPSVPDDVSRIPRPRVGFVGSMDAHTFDGALFVDVARRLGDLSFVLVGASSLPQGWCPLANVHQLGQKPYEEVALYMAACDVLIMPWLQNDWIRACNPVKLKEYLAVGRPIVSTYFPELDRFAGTVRVAAGAEQFADAVRSATTHGEDGEERRRARVRSETWSARAEEFLHLLDEIGIRPDPTIRPSVTV
jgi:glycosyltransferase involved in cell wall biosynthesis